MEGKKFLHVVPAYGRDYKNKKEVLAAWEAGNDFQICDISCRNDGAYVNKADAEGTSLWEVHVRYAKLSKIAAIKLGRKNVPPAARPAFVRDDFLISGDDV